MINSSPVRFNGTFRYAEGQNKETFRQVWGEDTAAYFDRSLRAKVVQELPKTMTVELRHDPHIEVELKDGTRRVYKSDTAIISNKGQRIAELHRFVPASNPERNPFDILKVFFKDVFHISMNSQWPQKFVTAIRMTGLQIAELETEVESLSHEEKKAVYAKVADLIHRKTQFAPEFMRGQSAPPLVTRELNGR